MEGSTQPLVAQYADVSARNQMSLFLYFLNTDSVHHRLDQNPKFKGPGQTSFKILHTSRGLVFNWPSIITESVHARGRFLPMAGIDLV